MKILAGIPSRRRDVTRAVNQIVPFVDSVVVVSYRSTIDESRCDDLSSVRWAEVSKTSRIKASRNLIFKLALQEGYDAVFQLDDDLRYPLETIELMLQILKDYPTLGFVSSDATQSAYWMRHLTSNKPFKIHGSIAQIWLSGTTVLKEIQEAFPSEEICPLETMEDYAIPAKCWTIGRATVKIMGSDNIFHQHLIKRSKTANMGGQSTKRRDKYMPRAVKYLQQFVGEDNVLKWVKCSWNEKTQQQKSRIRYNYEIMTHNVQERFESIGYLDSRGYEI